MLYFLLKLYCNGCILFKNIYSVLFRPRIKNDSIVFYDENGTEAEEKELKENTLYFKVFEKKKYVQIIRKKSDISKFYTPCAYDFCIFYVEDVDDDKVYRLDLTPYYLAGNLLDKDFFRYIVLRQHKIDIGTKNEINWMFIDHDMTFHILPPTCKILLEEESFQIIDTKNVIV
jgi:hypothetical protein